MSGLLLAPLTILLELDFALYLLAVLAGPVISPFTGGAVKLD